MQPHQLETIRLMVRFKLQVRRLLDQTVDLDQLATDPDYARLRLSELEAATQDEEFLVMLVQLRSHLLNGDASSTPRAKTLLRPVQANHTTSTHETASPALRHKYLYGARG